MPRHSPKLLELARHGAKARFRELAKELNDLAEAFPDVWGSFDPDELPISFILRRGARRAGRKATRRKTTLSEAGRKAISDAQKKRWAAKKAVGKK